MAKARSKKGTIITPNQQWLALLLLAILAIIAIFYFGIGVDGNGFGNSGS